MTLRKILTTVAIATVVVLVALGSRLFVLAPASNGQAAIGGAFTLVDQDGRTVTEKDFRGKYMLIYFGYTFCPDVCPTSLQAMGQALDLLPPDKAAKVTPVFITVDPERDSPDLLKSYVPNFHPRLIGLTGSTGQIEAASKAFKVYARKAEQKDGAPYLMDHSSILYLMGPDGRFVTHFSHGATPQAIADGLAKAVS